MIFLIFLSYIRNDIFDPVDIANLFSTDSNTSSNKEGGSSVSSVSSSINGGQDVSVKTAEINPATSPEQKKNGDDKDKNKSTSGIDPSTIPQLKKAGEIGALPKNIQLPPAIENKSNDKTDSSKKEDEENKSEKLKTNDKKEGEGFLDSIKKIITGNEKIITVVELDILQQNSTNGQNNIVQASITDKSLLSGLNTESTTTITTTLKWDDDEDEAIKKILNIETEGYETKNIQKKLREDEKGGIFEGEYESVNMGRQESKQDKLIEDHKSGSFWTTVSAKNGVESVLIRIKTITAIESVTKISTIPIVTSTQLSTSSGSTDKKSFTASVDSILSKSQANQIEPSTAVAESVQKHENSVSKEIEKASASVSKEIKNLEKSSSKASVDISKSAEEYMKNLSKSVEQESKTIDKYIESISKEQKKTPKRKSKSRSRSRSSSVQTVSISTISTISDDKKKDSSFEVAIDEAEKKIKEKNKEIENLRKSITKNEIKTISETITENLAVSFSCSIVSLSRTISEISASIATLSSSAINQKKGEEGSSDIANKQSKSIEKLSKSVAKEESQSIKSLSAISSKNKKSLQDSIKKKTKSIRKKIESVSTLLSNSREQQTVLQTTTMSASDLLSTLRNGDRDISNVLSQISTQEIFQSLIFQAPASNKGKDSNKKVQKTSVERKDIQSTDNKKETDTSISSIFNILKNMPSGTKKEEKEKIEKMKNINKKDLFVTGNLEAEAPLGKKNQDLKNEKFKFYGFLSKD